MRRQVAAVSLILAVLTIAGCNDRTGSMPTDPAPPLLADGNFEVLQLIWTLFPKDERGIQKGALDRFWDIQRALNEGNTTEARNRMFGLVVYTLDQYKLNVLLDPNGSNPPTTLEAVCTHIGGLFLFVTLPAPPVCPAVNNPEAVAAVVGPDGGVVTTGNHHAGVDVGGGAVGQTVLLTIRRLFDYPPGTGPLNTDLPQFPPYFEITTIPAVQLGDQVLVGVCVEDLLDPLRLAHNVGEGIEILERVEAPFLNCGADLGSAPADGTLWASLRRAVTRVFAPKPLSAASAVIVGGLGGLASSFSAFGAVDPTGTP